MDLWIKALDGSVGNRRFTMTQFHDNSDLAKALRASHRASGRPRYSVSWFEAGARGELWTSDRDAALAEHGIAAGRSNVTQVLTFDNLALEMIATHFLSEGRSYEEIAADADTAIDTMLDRWLAAE